jgi:choline dehydrogenase-like flavoprotein
MKIPTGADYIVVGGGLTGCALASRLARLLGPSVSILLLEAGPDSGSYPNTTTPMEGFALQGSELDWAYSTAPIPTTENRVITFPAGKTFGGGSCSTMAAGHGVMQAITMRGLELWAMSAGATVVSCYI